MDIPIYVVDSFTNHPFAGNPASVCILDSPVGDDWMQSVAAEMRHSETSFLYKRGSGHQLRWYTPTVEVDLCGHATLAAAHVLWETERLRSDEQAVFDTKSGTLTASLRGGLIEMDFPSEPPTEAEAPWNLERVLGAKVVWFGANRMDFIAELENEEAVKALAPDMRAVCEMGMRGLVVTARGSSHDFVSRFFAPQSGVDEDPVTGSAHCCLGPYWSLKLGKETLDGYQASARGGLVRVTVQGDRTLLCGHAVTVLEGRLKC